MGFVGSVCSIRNDTLHVRRGHDGSVLRTRALGHRSSCDTHELISPAISDFSYNRVEVDLLHKCVFFIQHYPPMPTTMSEINDGKRSSSDIHNIILWCHHNIICLALKKSDKLRRRYGYWTLTLLNNGFLSDVNHQFAICLYRYKWTFIKLECVYYIYFLLVAYIPTLF